MVWNIKTDTFGFKIPLKDKSATKRGMLSELSSVYDPLGLASPFIFERKKNHSEVVPRKHKMG